MQKIIDVLKPGDNRRDSFAYKRVFRTKWYDLRDAEDIEKEAEAWWMNCWQWRKG